MKIGSETFAHVANPASLMLHWLSSAVMNTCAGLVPRKALDLPNVAYGPDEALFAPWLPVSQGPLVACLGAPQCPPPPAKQGSTVPTAWLMDTLRATPTCCPLSPEVG